MKWCKSFSPGRPLRDLRAVRQAGSGRSETALVDHRKLEQEAYERGLADGEKRLSEQLLRQRAEVLEIQTGVLAALRQSVKQVVRQSESTLIEVALEVARQLVSGMPISTEMIEAAVRSALAQAEAGGEFHIQLHPEDLALLQKCNSPVLLPGPGNETMRFQGSTDVTRGGCLVQTRFGIIDARRETKMDLIRQSLDA
jgi:flagellar assembly protein FliH